MSPCDPLLPKLIYFPNNHSLLFTGDNSATDGQVGLARDNDTKNLSLFIRIDGQVIYHDHVVPINAELLNFNDPVWELHISFWLFCLKSPVLRASTSQMHPMPDAWITLMKRLREILTELNTECLPPIEWEGLLRRFLLTNSTDGLPPSQEFVVAAQIMLETITHGAVIWWQAKHLLGTRPKSVTAQSAIDSWGVDLGAKFLANTATAVWKDVNNVLELPESEFATWAKLGSEYGNPSGVNAHLVQLFMEDNWCGFDKLASAMWDVILPDPLGSHAVAFLNAIFDREHPIIVMFFNVWTCSQCAFRHTCREGGEAMPIAKLNCVSCGVGKNVKRPFQNLLLKHHFNPSDVQKQLAGATQQSENSIARVCAKLDEPSHGFPNFSKFKCSLTSLLAWLLKSAIRVLFLQSEKSASLTEALKAWDSNLTGERPLRVTHSMVEATWKCLGLSLEPQMIQDVFDKLLHHAPRLNKACSFTVIENLQAVAECTGRFKTTTTNQLVSAGSYSRRLCEFQADEVDTLEFLKKAVDSRKYECESCGGSHMVRVESHVDLTTCHELFVMDVGRDHWLTKGTYGKVAYAGGTRASQAFVPTKTLKDSNNRTFELQAIIVYTRNAAGAGGHYHVYVMNTMDPTFHGNHENSIVMFNDATRSICEWPLRPGVCKKIVMVIYGC